MNYLLLIFTVCSIYFVSGQNCNNGSPPSAQNLAFCTEYASSSCCSAADDLNLQSTFTSNVVSRFGDEGCAANIKALLCGWYCSPNNAQFTNYTDNATGHDSVIVYVNETFYAPFFQSCYNVCFIGSQISTLYTNAAGFLQSFSASNDAAYIFGQVNATYQTISSPNGGTFTHQVAPASGSDLTGCQTTLQCPLSGWATPQSVALSFCPEYATASCCSIEQDAEIKQNFELKVASFFGDYGCGDNIRKILCGFTCSPNQGAFSNFTYGSQYSYMNVYVNPQFANGVFDACKKVCLQVGGGILVSQFFTNGATLVKYLGSATDKTYVPSPTKPVLTYTIGSNPITGASFNTSNTLAQPEDQVGCDADGGSNSNSFASTITYSVSIIISILFTVLIQF